MTNGCGVISNSWNTILSPRKASTGKRGGGRIVAQGPPEDIAKSEASFTGHFLSRMLK
jgi:hypothetical protein